MATRLHRTRLLLHPMRETIRDLVDERPGIAFLELFHELRAMEAFGVGVGFGNLSYHLYQMERHGILTSRKAARYRRYYRNGGPQGAEATALSILQTEPVPALVDILLDEPGVCQQELWRRFAAGRSCSRQAVGYHLQRLERHGLVIAARKGRAKSYYPTEKLLHLRRITALGEPNAPAPGASPVPVAAAA